ncbi:hypothetical protein OROMI_019536 [Orobanche minor]
MSYAYLFKYIIIGDTWAWSVYMLPPDPAPCGIYW